MSVPLYTKEQHIRPQIFPFLYDSTLKHHLLLHFQIYFVITTLIKSLIFFFLKIWAYLPVWKTAYFLSCCVCLHSMLKTAYSNVLYLFPSSKCSPHISLKCLRYQRGMSLKKESLFLSQKKLHLLKVLLLPKFKKKNRIILLSFSIFL